MTKKNIIWLSILVPLCILNLMDPFQIGRYSVGQLSLLALLLIIISPHIITVIRIKFRIFTVGYIMSYRLKDQGKTGNWEKGKHLILDIKFSSNSNLLMIRINSFFQAAFAW